MKRTSNSKEWQFIQQEEELTPTDWYETLIHRNIIMIFQPSGAGARTVSGRVGKPAEQDDQSLNRLDRTVPSPPSSLSLSWPTEQRQETHRINHFIPLSGLWPMEARELQWVRRIWLRVQDGLAWGLLWGAGKR